MNIMDKLNIERFKLEDFAKVSNSVIVKKELIELPFKFDNHDSTHVMVFMLKKGLLNFTCGYYFTDAFGNMNSKTGLSKTKDKKLKRAELTYSSIKESVNEMIEELILTNEGQEELDKYRKGLKKAY